jgi:hypothetical protein
MSTPPLGNTSSLLPSPPAVVIINNNYYGTAVPAAVQPVCPKDYQFSAATGKSQIYKNVPFSTEVFCGNNTIINDKRKLFIFAFWSRAQNSRRRLCGVHNARHRSDLQHPRQISSLLLLS